jgi:hypothetical protein
MTIKVPDFKDPDVTKFFVTVVRELDRVQRASMSSNTANNSLLLYSPSLKVYEIKVSDTGVITATHVQG